MFTAKQSFSQPKRKPPTIAELYPKLAPAEQEQAEYNLRRYARLIWRIFERIERENPALLTKLLKEARLKKPESR